ncbi:tRNA uridine-5-carboxymethylaminomethyl(34) synthesis GTPase MnmE [Sulfurimonas sp.]|jgi:tRNA modification GTPase|uniref:tRNA uridine-5-carboxymethylaminomethyl(34) synthesis GTPase MnmE n=1 Tax=Sulfurimonas sp. TaxID=2022749 RepID=UPI0025FEAA82|nr:tRNA uridine-5-carboxymethylaminomethyl(34) synthesis GTPase MnmE [Sulfurimonas sp.]MBT5933866.1 tRNA uridine-5-carboxymethylaminomethyl(34) synthesis GTPase MnmE [Sulfurimonas sp.]
MTDTICSVATANGIGSIAIIRISGDKALTIAKTLTKKDTLKTRYATLSDVYNSSDELIDEAIIIYFEAPYSFTAEHVVEIQCHGGYVVAQSILKATLNAGARLAEAGEFSKRAFFNGRIDLSEAEAISQLIEAKSEDAAKILALQMKGSLKEFIESVRDEIIHILAYSEVTIDYAEEDLPEDLVLQIRAKLDELYVLLKKTLSASKAREGLMQGFRVAIIGKPNVGKSSLLNALLNYNRAIVSEIAGTTRDTIEEQVKIGTHLIKIVDTAGIRDANDEIERIGIQRSLEAIEESDIVVVLFDGSREADSEDLEIARLVENYRETKNIIIIKNKIDLQNKFNLDNIAYDLELNSKNDVSSLIDSLEEIMNVSNVSDEVMLISQRQISAVEMTMQNIKEAFIPLEDQELEIFSFHLNEAVKEMAGITRPFENDEMLDKMFGSFCLGK